MRLRTRYIRTVIADWLLSAAVILGVVGVVGWMLAAILDWTARGFLMATTAAALLLIAAAIVAPGTIRRSRR